MNKILIIFIAVVLFSCNKEQPELPTPVIPSILTFEFENAIDGDPISFEDTEYTTKLGQNYKVNAWKYFVSNIELYKNGVLVFKEKDSYHYINEKDSETLSFSIVGVDEGAYDEIRYGFGIDSLNNNGDARVGDIDPGTGMFWLMGGYRFSNFDGEFGNNPLTFHVGGNSNYTTLKFDQNIEVIIKMGETTKIHNMVNVNKMFEGVNEIDFNVTSSMATESSSVPIVQNIANGMFTIHHIENPQ